MLGSGGLLFGPLGASRGDASQQPEFWLLSTVQAFIHPPALHTVPICHALLYLGLHSLGKLNHWTPQNKLILLPLCGVIARLSQSTFFILGLTPALSSTQHLFLLKFSVITELACFSACTCYSAFLALLLSPQLPLLPDICCYCSVTDDFSPVSSVVFNFILFLFILSRNQQMVLTTLRTTYLTEWRLYFPWKSSLDLRNVFNFKF